jgi:O-antigen ligase
MESSIIKLLLLLAALLFLSPLAYVLKRPVAWAKPLVLIVLAISTIGLHYFLVQYSVNAQNTLSLLNGFVLLMTAIAAASAFSPPTCLSGLRTLALFVAYPVTAYLLTLNVTGSGYDDVGNFEGFTENSNTMGGYLALLMFPVAMQSLLNAKRVWSKAATAILLSVIIFLIFTTGSRASLLAILCGLAFVALSSPNIDRKYRYMIIAGVLLAPLFLTSFFQKNEDLALFSTRAFLYQLRFEAISERPWLGWGLAADVNNSYDVTNIFPPQEKGNTVLQMMEEFGVVFGTIFTVSLTIAIISTGRRLARSRATMWVPVFLVGAWVHSMFETWMFNFQSTIAIFFWLTFILATFHSQWLVPTVVQADPKGRFPTDL